MAENLKVDTVTPVKTNTQVQPAEIKEKKKLINHEFTTTEKVIGGKEQRWRFIFRKIQESACVYLAPVNKPRLRDEIITVKRIETRITPRRNIRRLD